MTLWRNFTIFTATHFITLMFHVFHRFLTWGVKEMSEMCDRIFVIVGGFATQLSLHVGHNIDGDPLWTARFNSTNPQAVIQTHLDYFEAGADIILTNTYQASVEGFTEYLHLNKEKSVELIKSTVELAHIALEKFVKTSETDRKPLIFASIGAYGAHLHDGSEYKGYCSSDIFPEMLKTWHKVRIDACVAAGVDGLAIETIPCLMEAEAVVDLILDEHPNMKFWVSFQCKDSANLACGKPFGYAVETIWRRVEDRKNKNLIAVGVNCVNPSFVEDLFKSVKIKIPFVVYPNSGEVYSVELGWHGKNTCKQLDKYVENWIELGGTRFIGGCCRTNADDVKKIKEKVDAIENRKNQELNILVKNKL